MVRIKELRKATVLLFLACSLFSAGCGKDVQTSDTVAPIYGVADMKVLLTSHPKYTTYFKEKMQYEHFVKQYENEKGRFLHGTIESAKIQMYLKEQLLRDKANQELHRRLFEKEQEYNHKLQELYEEIEGKYGKNGGSDSSISFEKEDHLRLVNLQMKVALLAVSVDEKNKAQEEIHKILNQGINQASDYDGHWSESDRAKMATEKQKYKVALESYASEQSEALKEKLSQDVGQMGQEFWENTKAMPPEEIESYWNEKIKLQRQKVEALYQEMIEDIKQEATHLAQEKNLKMIFVKYRVNRNAVDVTGDMAGRIMNIKK